MFSSGWPAIIAAVLVLNVAFSHAGDVDVDGPVIQRVQTKDVDRPFDLIESDTINIIQADCGFAMKMVFRYSRDPDTYSGERTHYIKVARAWANQTTFTPNPNNAFGSEINSGSSFKLCQTRGGVTEISQTVYTYADVIDLIENSGIDDQGSSIQFYDEILQLFVNNFDPVESQLDLRKPPLVVLVFSVGEEVVNNPGDANPIVPFITYFKLISFLLTSGGDDVNEAAQEQFIQSYISVVQPNDFVYELNDKREFVSIVQRAALRCRRHSCPKSCGTKLWVILENCAGSDGSATLEVQELIAFVSETVRRLSVGSSAFQAHVRILLLCGTSPPLLTSNSLPPIPILNEAATSDKLEAAIELVIDEMEAATQDPGVFNKPRFLVYALRSDLVDGGVATASDNVKQLSEKTALVTTITGDLDPGTANLASAESFRFQKSGSVFLPTYARACIIEICGGCKADIVFVPDVSGSTADAAVQAQLQSFINDLTVRLNIGYNQAWYGKVNVGDNQSFDYLNILPGPVTNLFEDCCSGDADYYASSERLRYNVLSGLYSRVNVPDFVIVLPGANFQANENLGIWDAIRQDAKVIVLDNDNYQGQASLLTDLASKPELVIDVNNYPPFSL